MSTFLKCYGCEHPRLMACDCTARNKSSIMAKEAVMSTKRRYHRHHSRGLDTQMGTPAIVVSLEPSPGMELAQGHGAHTDCASCDLSGLACLGPICKYYTEVE